MLSILDLDNYSLYYIFQFLSIYDLLKAEKVCGSFKEVCESIYSTKFRKVRIELRSLRTNHFRDILDRVGRSMIAFEFSGGYIMDENVKNTMIYGIINDCPRLKALSINYVQFTSLSFNHLQSCFSNLTSLDLSRCALSEATLGIVLDGEKFKNIKTLKLAGNSEMNGSFFKDMKHVEILDISYCYNLSFIQFLKFLENCIKLLELNITASCSLVMEDENFQEILLHHQPLLEKLIMDYTGVLKDKEVIVKFKHLKYSSFEGRKFGT
ncbi:CLUMA_CG017233, isoform A [Clunio marinus]|uniref:CLUMA_CG017233, isoform A n=1 Tax=Clunio marinus TaxID=568069 RepID=A0A1J1IZV4_9DIPT|nr:CLUMA_CG017233, isoform A [Clunio marinus]